MANLARKKFDIFVFILLTVSIFILYRQLFNSSFEADEWNVTAHYLPLTRVSNGLFASLTSPILDELSAGQHNIPIASIIYYLNTKFFGINYVPYAFMSLFLHAINSFLIFLFIKLLLNKKDELVKNLYAFLGAIFFAFAPTPMHTITGAAPFYGQNILSVTFFILCLFSFKLAFVKKDKKLIYAAVIFLFSSLFTKETSFFLFLLLPFMALMDRGVFSSKFLGKVFSFCLILYILIRFIVPNAAFFKDQLVNKLVEGQVPSHSLQKAKVVDTGTIVSRDISIYKNLPGEVILRTITFPLRMVGTLFLPRPTVFSIVQFITPIVIPLAALGDSTSQLAFLYGPGNFVIIYLASLAIVIFCLSSIIGFVKRKKLQEAKALATGLAIVIFSALPLVAIIFSFPRWGYDFYFDSRFYYNPTVGAAIIFPFLLFGIAKLISKVFNIKKISIVFFVIFIIWLVNNMYIFDLTLKAFVNKFGSDRREFVGQLKNYLPTLPKKTVFYFETDGLSAFGPALPFYTSVPQALAVVYYDKSPLPDEFLIKPLFNGKPEGYLYTQGKGLGYYTSKKNLAEALSSNSFSINDVYGFYYYGEKAKLKNITIELRKELTIIKK